MWQKHFRADGRIARCGSSKEYSAGIIGRYGRSREYASERSRGVAVLSRGLLPHLEFSRAWGGMQLPHRAVLRTASPVTAIPGCFSVGQSPTGTTPRDFSGMVKCALPRRVISPYASFVGATILVGADKQPVSTVSSVSVLLDVRTAASGRP